MEAPGFTPYAHGFHHEFALMRTNDPGSRTFGLCFCDHCVARAEKVEGASTPGRLKAKRSRRYRGLPRQRHRLPADMAKPSGAPTTSPPMATSAAISISARRRHLAGD